MFHFIPIAEFRNTLTIISYKMFKLLRQKNTRGKNAAGEKSQMDVCLAGFLCLRLFLRGGSSSVVAFARHYLQNAIVHQTKIIYKAGALKVNYSLRVV